MQPLAPDATTTKREDLVSTVERSSPLTVTALVCTSGRGDSVVETVQSILRPDSPCCELIVVDQSDDDRTQNALEPFRHDSRLRYLRTETKGKGVALNIGLEEAKGDIIAITDDDCKVDATWPLGLAEVLREHPQVAVVYGNVLADEYDKTKGYIPAYIVGHETLCRNIWHKLKARGIGANMAVRREVIRQIGGFDPELGPGGKFFACVDGDITVRSLLAGYQVYETTRSTVQHYGFRTWEQSRKLTHNAFYGIGAAYVKPLRCGRFDVIPLLLYEFLRYALFPSITATLTFQRPTNWHRVFSLLRGVVNGWRTPMDCEAMRYRPAVSGQRPATQDKSIQK
jgi:glycosyltransferase involved in cell wall biosynthesis